MKILRNLAIILCASLCCAIVTYGQNTIDAISIEQKIKAGEDVSYSNLTITGILDMTSGREEADNLGDKRIWNNNEIKTTASGNISFVNCTFEDHVYAYFNNKDISHTDGDSNYTFIVDFDGKVIFKDCTFKERAWFKYSDFDELSDFSGTVFEGSSTFKYAKFPESTSFANTRFEDDSSFKYTKFEELVSFENTTFEEDADFKYTDFGDGVSFENALFEDDLDFKYTQIDGEYNNHQMEVKGKMDVKNFKVNGDKIYKKEKRKNKYKRN